MGYKHDYDKAMTRLITILQRLYEGESLSVTELANEFGVSTRTIQRDFNEKLIQFPIVKDGKKWKMQDGFHLEKLKGIEEQLVLDLLEKMSENFGTRFSQKAKNLLSKIKNPAISPIYTSLNIEDISSHIDVLTKIENAILNQQLISCIYHMDLNSFDIKIKPLKVANFEGFWYLLAFDTKDDVLKKYHIKSMNNLKVLQEKFTISKDLNDSLQNAINIWFNIENKPFEVILHIDSEVSKYFQRKPTCKSQIITSINSTDESMELSVKITHAMEIIPTILHWIPHIKVIKPKWLNDEIKELIKKYIEKL